MNYLSQAECKDIATNLRIVRTCCVELTLCLKNDESNFDKVRDVIINIDRVLHKTEQSSEKQNNSLENIQMFHEFFKTTIMDLNKTFIDQDVTTSINHIKGELAENILKAVESMHKTVKFETSFERFKNSLNVESDSDVRQSVSRLFCVLVKRDEASKLFTPEIESCSRILSSYYAFNGSVNALTRIMEPLGTAVNELLAKSAEQPKPEATESPKASETSTFKSKILPPLKSESELMSKPSISQAEVNELREENTKLKIQVKRLTEQNESCESLLTDYMIKMPSLEGDLKAALNLVNAKEGEVNAMSEQNDKLAAELQKLQAENQIYKGATKYLSIALSVVSAFILGIYYARKR